MHEGNDGRRLSGQCELPIGFVSVRADLTGVKCLSIQCMAFWILSSGVAYLCEHFRGSDTSADSKFTSSLDLRSHLLHTFFWIDLVRVAVVIQTAMNNRCELKYGRTHVSLTLNTLHPHLQA